MNIRILFQKHYKILLAPNFWTTVYDYLLLIMIKMFHWSIAQIKSKYITVPATALGVKNAVRILLHYSNISQVLEMLLLV